MKKYWLSIMYELKTACFSSMLLKKLGFIIDWLVTYKRKKWLDNWQNIQFFSFWIVKDNNGARPGPLRKWESSHVDYPISNVQNESQWYLLEKKYSHNIKPDLQIRPVVVKLRSWTCRNLEFSVTNFRQVSLGENFYSYLWKCRRILGEKTQNF